MAYPCGDTYTGSFSNGKRQGEGRMVYRGTDHLYGDGGVMKYNKDGNVYEGSWQDGKRNGVFENHLCLVCFENKIDTVFLNCGHQLACEELGAGMVVGESQGGRGCREKVRGMQKVFKGGED